MGGEHLFDLSYSNAVTGPGKAGARNAALHVLQRGDRKQGAGQETKGGVDEKNAEAKVRNAKKQQGHACPPVPRQAQPANRRKPEMIPSGELEEEQTKHKKRRTEEQEEHSAKLEKARPLTKKAVEDEFTELDGKKFMKERFQFRLKSDASSAPMSLERELFDDLDHTSEPAPARKSGVALSRIEQFYFFPRGPLVGWKLLSEHAGNRVEERGVRGEAAAFVGLSFAAKFVPRLPGD